MRVVFMGTPDLAARILECLLKSEHEVAAVVTQPDRPKGRGGEMACSPVKELAMARGIPVMQPERARSKDFVLELTGYEPDIIVVAAFGQILSESVLNMPKFGCINVHTSLLPRYRGASPIQAAILNGDEKTGVTIMYMDKGIDTGDIIEQQEVKISPVETAGSLHDKLAAAGGELLVYTMAKIADNTAVRRKQNNEEATYVSMLSKSEGRINFGRSAVSIERQIRGMNPWPSAFTYYKGKTLKLWTAQVANSSARQNASIKPGTVLESGAGELRIMTGDGVLSVKELQLEGKRRMTAEEFLRGCKITVGEILGD